MYNNNIIHLPRGTQSITFTLHEIYNLKVFVSSSNTCFDITYEICCTFMIISNAQTIKSLLTEAKYVYQMLFNQNLKMIEYFFDR